MLTELAEQTNQHRSHTANLHVHAGSVRNQAYHTQTGFVLRRFNLDKTKEEYDAELERMNATMSAENQALQHDNKQLNALIKDYETTLDNVMTQFRHRAHEVQQQELSLVREYETKIIARETEQQTQQLEASTAFSSSLSRLSNHLRLTMRSLNGEDVTELPPSAAEDYEADEWDAVAAADWALERECELARLEKENEVLRRLLGQPVEDGRPSVDERQSIGPAAGTGMGPGEDGRQSVLPATRGQRALGGPKGTVGPFGTYKKMRGIS
ncbi:hypothetical protein EVG20_g7979 [Dentipellis fragilis]|uniref:Uncharacterized protein n=1 Tax=Dentipellis fragilis TaxID=205917 RepID=A0A4Y9YA50_9AGAM|nr:hypothetical protein EVG20_g7979 [Dentipellis fragilis]